MDFLRYSVNDFVFDESFQAFVADADSEAGRLWQAWLLAHPQQQAEADRAHAFVRALHQARPHALPAGLLPQELRRLRQALRVPAAQPRLRSQRRVRRLAGALGALLLASGLAWWQWPRPTALAGPMARYATGPNQQRTLTLPDGSVVTLNGSSALTTAAAWTAETPREVWLTGEGYFQVTHRAARPGADIEAAPASTKFVVHAGGLRVAVLGTQFDVNSRAGDTKVVLASGKVAVARQALLAPDNLVMRPGDLIETSAAHPALRRRHVEPALYSGWTQGRLRFRQTPMREVVQLLRDSYGLRVVFADSAMLRKTIVGEVPTTNPDVLLAALGKVLNSEVVRTGNAVRFLPARH